MQSASKSPRGAAEGQPQGASMLFATADAGGSLRIWSRWPLPQQLAEFTLQHTCTALSFLQPQLLLGCFNDGTLMMFDTTAFRVVGRLQLSLPQDPPVAIACLGGERILIVLSSSNLLSVTRQSFGQ